MTTVPFARTFGGRKVRNRRAGLAHVEKGLNLAVTSVINLVIILAVGGRGGHYGAERCWARIELLSLLVRLVDSGLWRDDVEIWWRPDIGISLYKVLCWPRQADDDDMLALKVV